MYKFTVAAPLPAVFISVLFVIPILEHPVKKTKKKVVKKSPAKLTKVFGKKKRKAVVVRTDDFEFPKADISEAGLRELLKKEVEGITMETLPAFMELALNRSQDYGTICVAIGYCAVAAAKAANRSKHGGITGFQASAVFWEFVRGWGTFGEGPKRMVNYTNLLYPQHCDDFTTISSDTWDWVKEEAAKNIAESEGPTGKIGSDDFYVAPHPDVLAHWKRIVESDRPPFGLVVKDQ
jgi:hypothetical protein